MKLHEIEKDEILINRMYVGSYLKNEHNIGHEVINLLRADGEVDENGDGQNYIYVQPWGTMQTEHNDKIDTIVLTRNTGITDTLEVLAKAWDLEQISRIEKSTHKKELENIVKNQIEYIKKNKITYNGKYLNEIYDENSFQQEVCLSFKAGKLRKPQKPMFIYFGNNYDNEKLNVLKDKGTIIYLNPNDIDIDDKSDNVTETVKAAKSSLKMYIKNNVIQKNKEKFVDQRTAFQNLKEILEKTDLWEDENTTKNVSEVEDFYEYDKSNFIDIIDKKDAEVTYSNLFKYIFESDYELFKNFAEDVLKIKDISANYKVEREEGHIDLLITDKNNVIVIENKIKSEINSIKYDKNGNIVDSQLHDYYRYITEYKTKNAKNENKNLKKKFENKKPHFYIFAPDYNKINIKKIKNIPNNTYKIIPYSRIYKFFNELSDKSKYSQKIQYLYEFIYAIEKHSSSVDNVLEIETHKKFIKKITTKN